MLRCSEYIFDSKTAAADISHALMANDVEFILDSNVRVKAHVLVDREIRFLVDRLYTLDYQD